MVLPDRWLGWLADSQMLVLADLGLGGTLGGSSASVSVTSPGGGGTGGGGEKGMERHPAESLLGAGAIRWSGWKEEKTQI